MGKSRYFAQPRPIIVNYVDILILGGRQYFGTQYYIPEREKFSVSPQSHSPFSASFQTFCLTAHAYLNTQKYGLFCSLLILRSVEDVNTRQ